MATRLFVQPLAEGAGQLSPIQSEFERLFAGYLFKKKCVFIKTLHPRELASVPNLPLGWFLRANSQPDFVLFVRGRIYLVECAGLTTPEYLAALAAKIEFYNSLRAYGIRHLVVVNTDRSASKLAYRNLAVGGRILPIAPIEEWPPERIFQEMP
jgi:hypothetical protein